MSKIVIHHNGIERHNCYKIATHETLSFINAAHDQLKMFEKGRKEHLLLILYYVLDLKFVFEDIK